MGRPWMGYFGLTIHGRHPGLAVPINLDRMVDHSAS